LHISVLVKLKTLHPERFTKLSSVQGVLVPASSCNMPQVNSTWVQVQWTLSPQSPLMFAVL